MSLFLHLQKCICSKNFLIGIGIILGIASTFVMGYQIAFRSWGRQISISIDPSSSSRGLASDEGERTIATLSHVEYSDPQRVFDKAKVVDSASAETLSFVIGNLLFTDSKGNTNFVCQNFSQVQLLFEAYGVVIEDEKVVMKLTTDCKKHSDHQYIGPFTIPSKKILNSSIMQSDFDEGSSHIHFNNVSLSWPRSWILLKAQFTKEDAASFTATSKIPESEDQIFSIDF